MTLDQYLSLADAPTATQFGMRCDPQLTAASISRIRRGDQNITRDTMRGIIEASGGLVTADDLVRQKRAA